MQENITKPSVNSQNSINSNKTNQDINQFEYSTSLIGTKISKQNKEIKIKNNNYPHKYRRNKNNNSKRNANTHKKSYSNYLTNYFNNTASLKSIFILIKLDHINRLDYSNEYISLKEFECGICYQTLVKTNITACLHNFCLDCLDKWLLNHKNCAKCNSDLRLGNIIMCGNLDRLIKSKSSIRINYDYKERFEKVEEYTNKKR